MSGAATAIGRRVAEAMQRNARGDYESALIQASIAVDATSKRTHPTPSGRSSRQPYQRFIHDNLGIISRVAFGNVTMLNLSLQYSHPDVEADAEGLCTFEQILYFVVRCGLLHAGEISNDIEFVPRNVIELKGNLQLPASLIKGVLVAVVLAPENAHEKAPGQFGFILPCGTQKYLDEMWGQRCAILLGFSA
jgi:hypothetical protein